MDRATYNQIKTILGLKNIEKRLRLSSLEIDDSFCEVIADKLGSCNTIENVDLYGKYFN